MNKWFKNISYSLLGKIIAMIFLMLLDICAARILDMNNYAEWVYFFSISTMLFYIGWFGINRSAKIFISQCIDDKEKINCLAAACLLRLMFSFFIAIMIVIVMPNMADLLGYPDKYPNLKWLLGFASVLVFFNSITEFFKEWFQGIDSFKKIFIITTVEYSGYFVFSVTGLLVYRNPRMIAFGYVVSGIVAGMIGCWFLYKLYKSSFYLIDNTFKGKILAILKYALPLMVISIGGLILVEMDTFMLGLLGTKEDVAIYNIAKNLCSKATHINNALTVGVMTSFASISKENFEEKKLSFRKAIRINLMVTMIVSFCFFLFAGIAIDILYGNLYSKAGELLKLLIIYYALYSISAFFSLFLDFQNKAAVRSICYLSVIVINLVLNYLLIRIYGSKGAALATDVSLIPYTIVVIILTRMQWKKFRVVGGNK